jgi:hypothetical protein
MANAAAALGNSQEAGMDNDDQDNDHLLQKNRQEDIKYKKIHEHKMVYVQKVEEMFTKGGQYAE